MNTTSLNTLPIGEIRYFDSIGSTNDYAMQWANDGAEDLSLVLADEQTAGRGRMKRKWFTPPGSALAMSLILRPTVDEVSYIPRATGLPALSLVDSLRQRGLDSQIKWPNDVLLSGNKVAGILVESIWSGNKLEALIMGMGVNLLKASVPAADRLHFPATSVEDKIGKPLVREEFLKDILTALLARRYQLGTDSFLSDWEQNLAFLGQRVRVWKNREQTITGELIGLNPDGSLNLRDENGKSVTVHFGEVHLRPLA
jgi:BirA family biotin operon repressor/biotin-[acetyl-CoA-carboxylase] ligase